MQCSSRQGRSEQDTMVKDEQVVARALCDKPIAVEHDSLLTTCVAGLDLGQNVVQVIQ